MLAKDFPILLAEDNPGDARLFREAMRHARTQYPLHVVQDGQIAIDYLEGKEPYADRNLHPLPRLIVLDINMPRVDGLEVLTYIRANRKFIKVPVIVVSGSTMPEDINRAYALGASTYMVKPIAFEAWQTVFGLCVNYWTLLPQYPDYTEAGLEPTIARTAA